MSNCKINLDNYNGCYYPGDEIEGQIKCNFNDETKIRSIKIRLKCKEYNKWRGTETYTVNGKTKIRNVTRIGDNDVINLEKIVFESDSDSRVFDRGTYTYPFSVTLPYKIPASFKGPYGFISYSLKAVVDKPWSFDYEDAINFQVKSPIDFNNMSMDLQGVINYSDEKTIGWCCCSNGEISMNVELPKLAFIPGENLILNITVCNLSTSNVEQLNVKFTKHLKYRVSSDSKKDTFEIASVIRHGVGANNEYTYNLQIPIPEDLEVPNFTNCTLFEVSYLLKVECMLSFWVQDLHIDIWDVELGNIQYFPSNTTTDIQAPVHSIQPTAPSSSIASAPPKENPPPSYEEIQRQQGET